jgi:hypothetical protein
MSFVKITFKNSSIKIGDFIDPVSVKLNSSWCSMHNVPLLLLYELLFCYNPQSAKYLNKQISGLETN